MQELPAGEQKAAWPAWTKYAKDSVRMFLAYWEEVENTCAAFAFKFNHFTKHINSWQISDIKWFFDLAHSAQAEEQIGKVVEALDEAKARVPVLGVMKLALATSLFGEAERAKLHECEKITKLHKDIAVLVFNIMAAEVLTVSEGSDAMRGVSGVLAFGLQRLGALQPKNLAESIQGRISALEKSIGTDAGKSPEAVLINKKPGTRNAPKRQAKKQ